jgi:phage-related tail fiber protein
LASLQSRLSDLITAIGTDVKQLRTWITGSASGDLTGLQTDVKTSLVAAVNELHSQQGSGAPDASETVKGIAELATLVEVATGTDTTRIVTPAGVKQETDAIRALNATETTEGLVELATLAEVATGTDSLRAVTPAGVRQERTALKDEILGAGVPAALDTLDELAAALGDDANYAASVTTALAGKQPLDADLTSIAGQVSAANKMLYATGSETWALTDLTAAGRAILDDADAAAQRTTLSVYSQADLGNPDTDLAALYTTAKT